MECVGRNGLRETGQGAGGAELGPEWRRLSPFHWSPGVVGRPSVTSCSLRSGRQVRHTHLCFLLHSLVPAVWGSARKQVSAPQMQ